MSSFVISNIVVKEKSEEKDVKNENENIEEEDNKSQGNDEGNDQGNDEGKDGELTEYDRLVERTERRKANAIAENKLSEHKEVFSKLEFWFNQYINPELNYEKQAQMSPSNIYYGVFNFEMDKVESSMQTEIRNAADRFRQHVRKEFRSKHYRSACDRDIVNILIDSFRNSALPGDFMGTAQILDNPYAYTGQITLLLNFKGHVFALYFNIENMFDRRCYQILHYHFIKYPRDLHARPNQRETARRIRIMNDIYRRRNFLPIDKACIVIFHPELEGSFQFFDDF